MAGYEIGQKPPGLAEDGSFDAVFAGIRVHSIVDAAGRILSVDPSTGLLVEDETVEKSEDQFEAD